MSALAERYAEATWRLAKTPAVGDRLVQEIVAFLALLDNSAELRRALSDPKVRPQAAALLRAIVQAGGGSELCAQLLVWLQRQSRLPLLYDIGWGLARRVDRALGRLRAHVRSAVPLTEAERTALEQAFAARFGKPVTADVRVDATLLGGFICRIGRLTFDSSLKRQLAQFTERTASVVG